MSIKEVVTTREKKRHESKTLNSYERLGVR